MGNLWGQSVLMTTAKGCTPVEFRKTVSQDVPSELYAQHLTGNLFPAWFISRVLLDTHCPNTFLSAFLFQTPSGISSVQLKKKMAGREVMSCGHLE